MTIKLENHVVSSEEKLSSEEKPSLEEKLSKAKEVFQSQMNRATLAALEVCARCGLCAESCHYYVADPRIEKAPAYRGEALRKLYRHWYDPVGRFFPKWVGAANLTEKDLGELAHMAFENCTLCRRCAFNCPMGIDAAELMRSLRSMLTAVGHAPEILIQLADSSIERGKSLNLFKEFFLEQIAEMEMELQIRTLSTAARIPIEKEGAEILYVALSGAHTILPSAQIFFEARANWTLSFFEASDYGVFLNDPTRAKAIAWRVVDEARRLGVKEVIISECGHAYAAFRWSVPDWFGPQPFRVRSILELIAHYLKTGLLKVDPSANIEGVTYHDSCNLARNGGVVEEPRFILKKVAKDFREMTPHGFDNYCCGGGGGLVANLDAEGIRLKAGKPKAEQVRRTGAKTVAVACDNCRLQLNDLNDYYHLGVEVTGVSELVCKALLKGS